MNGKIPLLDEEVLPPLSASRLDQPRIGIHWEPSLPSGVGLAPALQSRPTGPGRPDSFRLIRVVNQDSTELETVSLEAEVKRHDRPDIRGEVLGDRADAIVKGRR